MRDVILPPAVPEGATVAVVAPSGLPPAAELEAGLALLRERYDVRTYRELPGEPWGMMAGIDEVRAAELSWALGDPAIRCVVAARGGFGATRIVDPRLLEPLRRSPKLIVGFSDLTALVVGALAIPGVVAVHGPMVCQMGANGPGALDALAELVGGSGRAPRHGGLSTIRPGRAEGRLVGGNLTVLAHLVGTPLLPSLEGAILFFEEVGERPYRIDRCLTHLWRAGLLDGVRGLVVGRLTACDPQKGEHAAAEVLARHVARLGVPAAAGLPLGHEWPNVPLPVGVRAVLDATAGVLEIRSAAVEV